MCAHLYIKQTGKPTKVKSRKSRKSASKKQKIQTKKISTRSKRSFRGGYFSQFDSGKCMDDHDPIDMTEWDDDQQLVDFDVLEIPHETIADKNWCYMKKSLDAWLQINPNKNPRTNSNWTRAQKQVISDGLTGLDDTFEFSFQSPESLPLDQSAVVKINRRGIIVNWNELPFWMRCPMESHKALPDRYPPYEPRFFSINYVTVNTELADVPLTYEMNVFALYNTLFQRNFRLN